MLSFIFNNTPLMFFVQPFWRDEAFSYLLAKKNILEILSLTAKDFNPPLYYLVLHFWLKIFGPSEIAIRSLSLIFFWATIYVVFLFLTKILKIKSFLFLIFYLLFFIINPLVLYYGFESRMYTMFAFFAVLSYYAFFKKKSSLYLFSSLLGLYTHYFMIFVILEQIIYLFIFEKRKTNLSISQSFNLLIISLLFLPWMIFIFFQKNNFWQSFWIEKMNLTHLPSVLGVIYTGYEYSFKFFDKSILKLSSAFIFLIIIGFLRIAKKNFSQKKLFYYLFLWGVGIPALVGVASFFKPLFLPRYLIFSTLGLLLLVIFILEQLPTFLRAAIFLIIFAVSLNYHQLQIKYRKKADLRKIIKEIKYLAKRGDVLYVTDELNFHIAQYYFNENDVYIYGKTYEEIPNYVGKVLIPKEKVTNKLPLYPKKAFILTSDSHYEIQAAF